MCEYKLLLIPKTKRTCITVIGIRICPYGELAST